MQKSQRQRIINQLKQLDQYELDGLLRDAAEARSVETAGAAALRRIFAGREARARSLMAGIFGGSQPEE